MFFPGTSSEAAAELTPLADRAGDSGTLQPGPGQYYYRRTRPGHGSSQSEAGREEWLSNDGQHTLAIHHGGGRIMLGRGPVYDVYPTDGMPTEPVALEKWLRARVHGSLTQDEAVWEGVRLIMDTNPSPTQRAALIKVLPRISHVTVTQGRDELGRRSVIATRVEPLRGSPRDTLYFDPTNGHVLQQQQTPGWWGGKPWSLVTVEERLTSAPPLWVPLPGKECRRVESDPDSEEFDCG